MARANIYIDGFNLYHGICETGDKTVLWLDLVNLSKSLIHTSDQLHRIRYFTALPQINADKIRRGQGPPLNTANNVTQLSIQQLVNFRMAHNIDIGNRNRITMPVSWISESSNPLQQVQAVDQLGTRGQLYIEGLGMKKVLNPLHPIDPL